MNIFGAKRSQSLWDDISSSCLRWRQWGYLARVDIVARYRRSVIGPFWLTLTTGFMLVAIGGTYSFLWQGNVANFMPYFGVSYILWNSLAGLIGESTEIYAEAGAYIQNYHTPKFFWVLRTIARNLLMLAHMLPLYIILALCFPDIFKLSTLASLLVALPIYIWHCCWVGALVAAGATRYHDLKRLIPLLLSMTFLVTPILWKPEVLKEHTWIYDFNPFYYLIELVRRPLLGEPSSIQLWLNNLLIAVIGTLAALKAHKVALRRVFYWL